MTNSEKLLTSVSNLAKKSNTCSIIEHDLKSKQWTDLKLFRKNVEIMNLNQKLAWLHICIVEVFKEKSEKNRVKMVTDVRLFFSEATRYLCVEFFNFSNSWHLFTIAYIWRPPSRLSVRCRGALYLPSMFIPINLSILEEKKVSIFLESFPFSVWNITRKWPCVQVAERTHAVEKSVELNPCQMKIR